MNEASTDLVVLPTADVVFQPGGAEEILDKITREVRSVKTDISTVEGRAAIRSLAYKVARSKTALDGMGKDLVGEWKARANAVDGERRNIREKLDALKDEVRKPLDDWEEVDRQRIAGHEAALGSIHDNFQVKTASEIKERLAWLDARPERDWQEFAQRAEDAMAEAKATLTAALEVAERREAEAAELERLRLEKTEREQRERDEQIAAEAAEKATAEANAEAEAEVERQAAKVEKERREAGELAERQRQEIEKAEADRIAAIAKAKADAEAAVKRAQAAQQAAIDAEREQVAKAKAAADAETAKREADKKHRDTINTEAVEGILEAAIGLDRIAAVDVVHLIARDLIPHVKISY